MLNHIVIMGRLTRDPELRYTASQVPVATFTVAVDRDFQSRDGGDRQTDFITCVAWRQTAEFVNKYFHKGSMVIVSGRLQIRQYQDREGNNRTAAEVVADNVYFGESKRDSESRGNSSYGGNSSSYGGSSYGNSGSYGGGYGGGYEAPRASAPAANPGSFSEISDEDGELPF